MYKMEDSQKKSCSWRRRLTYTKKRINPGSQVIQFFRRWKSSCLLSYKCWKLIQRKQNCVCGKQSLHIGELDSSHILDFISSRYFSTSALLFERCSLRRAIASNRSQSLYLSMVVSGTNVLAGIMVVVITNRPHNFSTWTQLKLIFLHIQIILSYTFVSMVRCHYSVVDGRILLQLAGSTVTLGSSLFHTVRSTVRLDTFGSGTAHLCLQPSG